jgi:hypothetical protein
MRSGKRAGDQANGVMQAARQFAEIRANSPARSLRIRLVDADTV